MIRYAIRFTTDSGSFYHVQGLPNLKVGDDGFGFAVLYASYEHAKQATKTWKLRTAIKARTYRAKIHIVEVECKVRDEYPI